MKLPSYSLHTKQGRNRPLDTPKRKIKRRKRGRESEREKIEEEKVVYPKLLINDAREGHEIIT